MKQNPVSTNCVVGGEVDNGVRMVLSLQARRAVSMARLSER